MKILSGGQVFCVIGHGVGSGPITHVGRRMPLSRRAASDDRLDVPDNGVDLVDVGVEVGAYLRVGYAGGGGAQRRAGASPRPSSTRGTVDSDT